MKHLFGPFALLILFAASSCKKHDHDAEPSADVTTTISAPTAGQTFRIGDTVRILANVRYGGEMHGYKAVVADSASGVVRWSSEETHVHGDHFSIDEQWIPSAGQTGTARLQVRTAINHEGNEAVKEVFFYVLP